jgi:hypothetical protein
MYLMLGVSPLVVVALVIPAAGFLVRVFVVFHDCTHGSLLPSGRANTWVGRCDRWALLEPSSSTSTSQRFLSMGIGGPWYLPEHAAVPIRRESQANGVPARRISKLALRRS